MNALLNLNIARDILLSNFYDKISELVLLEEHFSLKLIFKHGERLYVRYNDYGEYSYQFYHSPQLDDFIRFDNFDDRWPVATRPHHLHTINNKVIDSIMIGDPNQDIPKLSQEINVIFLSNKHTK